MKLKHRLLGPVVVVSLAASLPVAMARMEANAPPHMRPEAERADAIELDKSDRRLRLLRDGAVIAEYQVSLGGAPEGHKAREGDERTPTGQYVIDWRNANSVAHLSLHISYPNLQDVARAEAAGTAPGGNIMIHGMLNGWGWIGGAHRALDWTDGCIAVTNAEMREIWALVPNGTPITITE